MDTNLGALFGTDKNLEENGVWFAIGGGVEFLIRRFSAQNSRMKMAMAKYYKPRAREIDNNTISTQDSLEINVKIFVSTCLINWKGVKDSEGKELPYNAETAIAQLIKYPDLYLELQKLSQSAENYREELGNF